MQDLPHHLIEVRDDIRITPLIDDAHPILEGRERLIQTVTLVIGNPLIVVERHIVRIIFPGHLTEFYHTVLIVLCPGIAHQMQTGCRIVRCQFQDVVQDWLDTVCRHLFQVHIGGTQHGNIHIRGIDCHHLMEHTEYLRTVTTGLFIGPDNLSDQVGLLFQTRIPAQQHPFRQRVCHHLVLLRLIIGTQ